MTIFLFTIASFLMLIGVLGSFLPVLPGVPLSWLGLLAFYIIPTIPVNYWLLGITLFMAVGIYVLNWVIPAIGTRKLGGSKAGMIGATLGLILGILTPVPFGMLIGPFVGAFIGEMIHETNSKTALRAALGSFLGFLASTFMEFIVALAFLILFIIKTVEFQDKLF